MGKNESIDTLQMIGSRINSALVFSNKRQKELAANLGVTDNTISYFCNGKRVPNTGQIIKIARFFNVSSDWLLGLSDVKSYDADLKSVCNYTGLNEMAIAALSLYNKDFSSHIDTINLLISEGLFHDLAKSLSLIKSAETENQKKYRKYDFMEFMVNLANKFVKR